MRPRDVVIIHLSGWWPEGLAEPLLTPVVVAALGIWGSRRFSGSWFTRDFP